MQRLWLVVLCLLAAAVPVYSDHYPIHGSQLIGLLSSKRGRLEAIRGGLVKFRRTQQPFQMPAPDGGMNFEVPADLVVSLRNDFHQRSLANLGFAEVVKLSELIPLNSDCDQVVAHVLHECEGWKNEADRLLLESLNGPDDPGFFTVIEWQMNRPER
jgi:hypothetical protein